jgi:DNA-binding HxlR family transcriptional regulator
MLVKELKSMEENKIVKRTAYPTVPATVEYALTEKGKEIQPILQELRKWGMEHA